GLASNHTRIFNPDAIADPTTLNIRVDKDWHAVPGPVPTLQKNLTVSITQNWWPGQPVDLPLILVVPKGQRGPFNFVVANASLTAKKITPSPVAQKLLKRGIAFAHIGIGTIEAMQPVEKLNAKMNELFLKTANPRYTSRWIWGLTYMRAITGALTEPEYFKPDKIALTGGSKRGVATCAAATWDPRVTAILPVVPPVYDLFPDSTHKSAIDAANRTFHQRARQGDFGLTPETYRNIRATDQRRATYNLDDNDFASAGWSAKKILNAKTATGGLYKAQHNYPLWQERQIDTLAILGSNDNVSPGLANLYQAHPDFPALVLPGGHHGSASLGYTRRTTVDPLTLDTTLAFFSNHFFTDRPMMMTPTLSAHADAYAVEVVVTFPDGPAPDSSVELSHMRHYDHWLATPLEPVDKNNPRILRATIPVFPDYQTVDILSLHTDTINNMPAHISGPYTQVNIPR
ncbi:MAG: PhoPQ-activated protein PqaA family protein, partial [Planctomycetota bacterium]